MTDRERDPALLAELKKPDAILETNVLRTASRYLNGHIEYIPVCYLNVFIHE